MNEIQLKPMVDILTELMGSQIVMSGDNYVYLSNSEQVSDEEVLEAKELQDADYIQQGIDKQVSEYQAYLDSTDFKMTVDYDQDVIEVTTLRAEARTYIRENS